MTPPATDRRPHLADERGAAAVELALVLPILVMLLVGIVEFGRGWDAKLAVASAVREGARAAATGGDAVAAARLAASQLDQADLDIDVTMPTPCNLGQYVFVEASYPYRWEVPFVGGRTVTLESRTLMRCGG